MHARTLLFVSPIALFAALGCASTRSDGQAPADRPAATAQDPRAAIATVLERDGELSTERNHASEAAPLATAVERYAQALARLDFSGCPPDFAQAYERHRLAWRDSLPLWRRFGELRGEMHALIDAIRAEHPDARPELERALEAIWSTWGEVEASAARHGMAIEG